MNSLRLQVSGLSDDLVHGMRGGEPIICVHTVYHGLACRWAVRAPGMKEGLRAWWWKRLRWSKSASSTKNLSVTGQSLASCLPVATMHASPA